MTPLNQEQKESIRRASRDRIRTVFQSFGNHFDNARWLAAGNRYSADCIKTLKDDTQLGLHINNADLSEYITASAVLHCTDGWSLIGRALDAHANNDPSIAIHLGYYAELRASMALLATEGIGIFDDRHFVVTANRGCRPIGRLNPTSGKSGLRTHVVAWQALEYWSGQRNCATLLRQIIRPGGLSLGEWLDTLAMGNLTRSIGKKWLKDWGLDLKRLSLGNDREARNQASYRPAFIQHPLPAGVSNKTEFLRSFWNLCEPGSVSRFENLDRYLLRKCVDLGRQSVPYPNFDGRLTAALGTMFPDSLLRDEWRYFLMRTTQPNDPLVLVEAARNTPVGAAGFQQQLLSRALLLLRLATGACESLIHSNAALRGKLEFWWAKLGEEHGLWENGSPPDNVTDLWDDTETAMAEVDQWIGRNMPPTDSIVKWKQEMSHQIQVLSEGERAALWGLGL